MYMYIYIYTHTYVLVIQLRNHVDYLACLIRRSYNVSSIFAAKENTLLTTNSEGPTKQFHKSKLRVPSTVCVPACSCNAPSLPKNLLTRVRKCRLQEEFNSSWLILAWQPCFSAATQLVSERFLLHLQRCFQVEKVHRGEGEESISGRASWSAYGLRVLSKRAAETAKNGRRKIRSQEM